MSSSWLRMTGIVAGFVAIAACGEPGGPPADGGSLGPPDPWTPPSQGAPECELSADCPEGTFCDLGECIQECNLIDPCTGALTCIARGRCAESADAPSDPAPPTAHVAEVRSELEAIYLGPTDAVAVLRFVADPSDEPIRYRVDPTVPWLRAQEPRGTFTGALTLMLDVDRTALGIGSYVGSVVLRTNAGDASVNVVLEQSITGVYQGEIEYTTPRSIGRVPVRVEAIDRDGLVDLRILADESPTFPRAGGLQATATAAMSGSTYAASIIQRIPAADLGGAEGIVNRDIGREVRLQFQANESGGLEGELTERWFALFPSPVEVGGTIRLMRLPDLVPGEFSVGLPPELPSNPSVSPPAITQLCYDATVIHETESGTPCSSASSAAQLRACGRRILARASAFAGADLVLAGEVPDPSGSGMASGFEALATQCELDFQNAAYAAPGTVTAGCVHLGNLSCAHALFGRAAQAGDADAAAGLTDVAAARASVATILLNDRLVSAFEAPFRTTSGITRAVLDQLAQGRARALPALQEVFAPHLLESLRSVPPALAASGDFEGLRRVAELVARDRMAAEEIASIRLRSQPGSRAEVRREVHTDALDLLLTLVALSAIESAQLAPPSPELGLFADALTALGQRSSQAQPSVNPLGLPDEFVPFVFNPARVGSAPTNFEQVLADTAADVSAAVAAETAARAAAREYELAVSMLEHELEQVADRTRAEQIDICGARGGTPAEPDLEGCGTTGVGTLAQALALHEQAVERIELARVRLEGHDARITIQMQRLSTVWGIRQETLEFLDSTNAAINAIQIQRTILQTVVKTLEIASNAQVFNGGAPAAMAAAVAIMGAIDGALGIAQQQLEQAQAMRIRTDDVQIEYVNGMATIQEMLTQMAELAIEVSLAVRDAAIAAMRVATERARLETVAAEDALLRSRVTGSRWNDPTFRILRDQLTQRAIAARERALARVYLAARAFEFETNTDLPAIETDLIPATSADQIQQFVTCLQSSAAAFRAAYGAPQSFTDEISLREDVFGIRGPVPDPVTGEVISEAEQFRRILLQPSNLGPDGTAGSRSSPPSRAATACSARRSATIRSEAFRFA